MLVGYKLINVKTNEVLQTWGGTPGTCPGIPNLIVLPNGDLVNGISIGEIVGGYRLDPWDMDPPPPNANDVTRERDRRIDSGFDFNGVRYQSRQEDRENIAGAGTLASIAIMNGAQVGDLRWHGGSTDFVWIAEDNSLVPMDAHTVIEFGKAAAAWKSRHIFAARALKNGKEIPTDYTDDKYWEEV